MNARAWLMRLYPREWRERYGEEFEALLEQCLHTPLDALDVALGALDAHLGSLSEVNWRLLNMLNKLRTSILIIFTAYFAFILAGLSLVGLVDDSPAAALMKADANTSLSAAWNTIAAFSVLALLAVVIGGMPLAVTLIRRAFTTSRRTLPLLLVPVVAFLALVLYGVFMVSVGQGWIQLAGVNRVVSPDNFPLGNKVILGGFMLAFILGAIASMLAVWRAVASLETEGADAGGSKKVNLGSIYRFGFVLAGVAALAMLVMLLATLAFGWLANAAVPEWFPSNLGLLLSNTGMSYGVTVTIMVLATMAAIFGLARGLQSRQVK